MPFLAAIPAGIAAAASSGVGAGIIGSAATGIAGGISSAVASGNAAGAQKQALDAQQQALGQLQGPTNNQTQALINQLAAQAQGNGPGQAITNQQISQGIGEAAGTVSSVKGLSPALAARFAGQQAAQIEQGGAALRAQQQLAAQQQLGGLAQSKNQNITSILGNGQQAQANIASANQQAQGQIMGGTLSGIGSNLASGINSLAPQQQVPKVSAAHGGEINGPRSRIAHYFAGGDIDMRSGGHVPGQAKVKGDSLKNDTIPAMLSPGEIVIPRTVAQGPDAAKRAAAFVAAVKAKKKNK